ncbi:S8 family peptidase [Paraclostridium sordellii]|uniref:S8 family peptidase n=1 Tax=Paraclostridium sordellii TaxID=1505 RepID=UPI00189847D5|nr:S8 family serine peptidase [Paeniclostridium sordellii]
MLNKIKRTIQILIMSILFILILNPSFRTVEAKSFDNDKKIDLLLNENSNIQKITHEIKAVNPNIQITKYEEISLLHLDFPEEVSSNDILTNKSIKNEIELVGNAPDVKLNKKDLGNTVYSKNAVLGESQTYSRHSISDISTFDSKGWHVDEVTEKRKSFDISKGEGIKIALIDSGVDYNHPALANSIDLTNAKSFVKDDSSVSDTNGHGTMVAGIIKQVAPDVKITPYRVMGDSTGESLWTIDAIIQAVKDGHDIINASLGTYKDEDIEGDKLILEAFKRAINYAKENNVIVIASAGNKGLDLCEYYKNEHINHLPGNIDGVDAVSAVRDKQLTSYSNYGMNIQYCAPGGDVVYLDGKVDLRNWIYCIYPTNLDNGLSQLGVPQGYSFSFGTSFSAPIVSAGAADILAYYRSVRNNKEIRSYEVEEALAKGAEDLGEKGQDSLYGKGKINIYNSLKSIN